MDSSPLDRFQCMSLSQLLKYFFSVLTFYFIYSLGNNQINLIKILPELSFYLISFYRIIPSVQQIYQSSVSIKEPKPHLMIYYIKT